MNSVRFTCLRMAIAICTKITITHNDCRTELYGGLGPSPLRGDPGNHCMFACLQGVLRLCVSCLQYCKVLCDSLSFVLLHEEWAKGRTKISGVPALFLYLVVECATGGGCWSDSPEMQGGPWAPPPRFVLLKSCVVLKTSC